MKAGPRKSLDRVGPVGADPVEPGRGWAPRRSGVAGRELPLHLEVGRIWSEKFEFGYVVVNPRLALPVAASFGLIANLSSIMSL